MKRERINRKVQGTMQLKEIGIKWKKVLKEDYQRKRFPSDDKKENDVRCLISCNSSLLQPK